MFSAPATLIGLAGVVFLAGSFTSASFSLASLTQSQALASSSVVDRPATGKSNRSVVPFAPEDRVSVSIVEVVGVTNPTVILRDVNGEVLYRSDPRTGTTLYAKDTELPVITLKEQTRGPAVHHPVQTREGTEVREEQKPKRRTPVGCMGDVSPLARAAADRTPSLCLAQLEQPLS